MIRLKREDFDDPHDLAKLAATAHLSVDEFRDRFAYLIDHESAPRVAVGGASPQASFL
jgi:transcriptional regulator GlxA family with amidase domain